MVFFSTQVLLFIDGQTAYAEQTYIQIIMTMTQSTTKTQYEENIFTGKTLGGGNNWLIQWPTAAILQNSLSAFIQQIR